MAIVVKLRCAIRGETKVRERIFPVKDAAALEGVSPRVESDVVLAKVQEEAPLSKEQGRLGGPV
jgi:hypothetical protein